MSRTHKPVADLIVRMHARVSGRVRWQVLDERGVPEVPRTPSGFPIGPAEGIEQPNLITNRGLDDIGIRAINDNSSGTAGWRGHLEVGTGSSVPDVTDTVLDNPIQKAANSGGFTELTTNVEDTVNDLVGGEYMAVRVVTMTADRNLTEFGLTNLAAAGSEVNIRELFRDSGGTPVTISLLNERILRLDHTLRVVLPWPETMATPVFDVEEYDAASSLIGTTPYDVTTGLDASSTNGAREAVTLWTPANMQTAPVRPFSNTPSWARNDSGNVFSVSTNGEQISPTADAYTVGTYQRRARATFTAAQVAYAWYGFFFYRAVSGATAFVAVKFDDPATLTKLNTQTVRVGRISTWARAAEGS